MEGSELKSYCPQNIKLAVAGYFQDWGQQADLPDSRLAKQLQVIQKSGIKHINNTFRNTEYILVQYTIEPLLGIGSQNRSPTLQ